MKPIPLLFLSDAVTAKSGLARITRDLASRVHKHLPDVYRVGTCGYGGPVTRQLGFPNYPIDMENWVVKDLHEIWQDFAGDEKGALLSIWDASRLLWLSRPENCPDIRVQNFLRKKPFKLWTYTPMDATGPNGKLTAVLKHTLEGFDRVLAYSKWAEDILRRTLVRKELLDGLTNLPHGIDMSVFYPRKKAQCRHGWAQKLGVKDHRGEWVNPADDALMIGIVATNQARKDWGLAMQAIAEIKKSRKVFLWLHTDVPERYWSIPALVNDFGLTKETVLTTVEFSDEQMAWSYSVCDVFLAIGMGEGFGYGAAEALCCGTSVVAPNYGGAEYIPQEFLVEPAMYRVEGAYNCYRPVMEPGDFKDAIIKSSHKEFNPPLGIMWDNLWPRWEKWFRDGAI